MLPPALQNLVDEFARLPGIGPRSAERLALYVLKSSRNQTAGLADALVKLHENIKYCRICHNLGDTDLCRICANTKRDQNVICVVEDALDVLAIERTASYQGLYHVLGGVISPMEGIGPDQLNIKSLLERLRDGKVKELIIATNPNTEGETTAMYIQKQAPVRKVKITRPASGLPIGSDLEYADQITLGRALENRQDL